MKTLLWFRQDLRISDNPALLEAIAAGSVLPVYILDDDNAGSWQMGGASRWWLHQSLQALNSQLEGNLCLLQGDPLQLIPELAQTQDCQQVFWNRCYEPWQIARDTRVKSTLSELGIDAKSFNGSLLWEPWQVLKKDQTPYKVFTPFYRKGCLQVDPPRAPTEAPALAGKLLSSGRSLGLDELNLMPEIQWYQTMAELWQPGEAGAKDRLQAFLAGPVSGYKEQRNIPSVVGTSSLSPYLHFGEISPHQVWYASIQHVGDSGETNLDHFLSELGWREFSYYLLYHFPTLPEANFKPNFDAFPWRESPQQLLAWQKGLTGVPIVDAGMRELWQTGYMHNRVRMIVASYLIKNLRIHWREGEHWFWDCLVDADLASNSASWQWVAGSGADAAPYFRIFNPVSQGEKFDPQGTYVKQYCPELSRLPDKYIHCPWEAPEAILKACGVTLGQNYPKPLVDLKLSRQQALDAYSEIKVVAQA